MLRIVMMVLIAESLTAAGQVFFKKSTHGLDRHDLRTAEGNMGLLRSVCAKPQLWYGNILLALGLVFWIFALSEGDLSIVYPLGSMQYIIILFAAHFFLGEKIDRMKFIGTFLVVIGILVISFSR